MVWFSKQKIIIAGVVLGVCGAYLLGWFDIILALARGEPIPSSVDITSSVGGILLTAGTWVMKLSGKFAKHREV